MLTCPQCQFTNAAGAESCARCGHPRYVLAPPAGDIPAQSGGTAAVLAAPAALTAPVFAPKTPAPDNTPLPSHPPLTLSLRPKTTTVLPAPPSDVTPPPVVFVSAPATVHDKPVAVPPSGSAMSNQVTRPALTDADLTAPPSRPAPPAAPAPPPPPPPLTAKLVVLRGLKIGVEFPVYEGRNTIGRFVDKPVDIDLTVQESVEQTWCSRCHAAVTLAGGNLVVEDLNSLNGTWVNGARIAPGHPRPLKPFDVIQIGTVQLKLIIG